MKHVVVVNYHDKNENSIFTSIYKNPSHAWDVVGELMSRLVDSNRYLIPDEELGCMVQSPWEIDLKNHLINQDFEEALCIFNTHAVKDSLQIELKEVR